MRIKLTLDSDTGSIALPVHYNHLIQGFIYSNIDKKLAEFLHKEGYIYEKRRFKFFVFSRIMGKPYFDSSKNEVTFYTPVYIFISSPISRFIESLVENFLRRERIELYKQSVFVKSVEVIPVAKLSEEVHVKMLSPVTVYSTFMSKDGKKKTYYYSPFEKDFLSQIRENLKKKYIIFSGCEKGFRFEIFPYRVRLADEKIVMYKNVVVKGWMGVYLMRGSIEAIKLAYDVGIGARNSQGFGMVEVINIRE